MSTVLHAGFTDGLVLWAERSYETSEDSAQTPSEVAESGGEVPAHPFAASLDRITDAFERWGTPLSRRRGERAQKTATVWLPAAGGQPLPSTAILGDAPSSRRPPELLPFRVPCLEVATSEFVDVLVAADDRAEPLRGVVRGPSLVYFHRAFRFVAELAAEGLFLPGLVLDEESAQARWEWVPLAEQRARLAKLAASMPASARCLGSDARETSAEECLRAFVDHALDLIVRDAVLVSPGLRPASLDRHPPPKKFSVHERWLRALTSSDSRLEATSREAHVLDSEIRHWREPLNATRAAPLQLCFRLREPVSAETTPDAESVPPGNSDAESATDEARAADVLRETQASDPWRLEYYLRPATDPSLLVPAADVFAGETSALESLAREGADPHAFLLAALGRAAKLCEAVESSLSAEAPAGALLEPKEAHAFLVRDAVLLEHSGFAVQLPDWWARRRSRPRLAARARARKLESGGSGVGLGDLVHVDWEVALGDSRISQTELHALAKLKLPLVRVRGRWVELDEKEMAAALRFWEKRSQREEPEQLTVRELALLAIGAEDRGDELDVAHVAAEGELADVMARLQGSAALVEHEAPDGFVGTLRPYQKRGLSWLVFLRDLGLGACLADDMGLGKTIQVLAVLERDRESGSGAPVLLVCPTSVVANWQREAERFTPELKVVAHHGPERLRGEAFARMAMGVHLVVTSYALLARDLETFEGVEWAGLVLDEAQNVKNPETKQARAARSLRAPYRMALTGTPVENHVGDLWSLMEFLNPGLLGSRSAFREKFFLPIQTRQDADATSLLQRITRPFVLRRLKTDKAIVAELPEKFEHKVYCSLEQEQATLYQAVLDEAEESLHGTVGIQRRGVVLALITKLKQVCNHPAHFLGDGSALGGRSGKLERLTEMLEEALSIGDRALVFTQFAEMGALLHRWLEEQFGREVLYLHGGTPKRKRDEMVQRFQEEEEGPAIFLLSLRAGGTGLNLTRANHVFHYDRWWNPAVENQATDRAFRIGQTRNVQVHKMICAGTLEESVDALLERKKDVAEHVVGTGEGWLMELSTDELRDVLALRRDVVGA